MRKEGGGLFLWEFEESEMHSARDRGCEVLCVQEK